MAHIVQEEKKGSKKRPKKGEAFVDMTPMVDLMSLLITFFMLTAAFSKPKVMEIILPEKIRKERFYIPQDNPSETKILERLVSWWGKRFRKR